MENLKIHFLNTVWSDAIILESNNKYAFIDTGSLFYYPMIKNHLQEYNINTIEFILLTHFHSDHYGNVINLLKDKKVNKLYIKRYYGLDGTTAKGYTSNEEYTQHELMTFYQILDTAKEFNTEVIFVDELGLETLNITFDCHTLELYDIQNTVYKLYCEKDSPYYQQKAFNENYSSIGVFIKVNDKHIFLGSDVTCSKTNAIELQERAITMINKHYQKYHINHIDIYKSCHHGGGGTNTLELCKLLNPDYAIITNTDQWLDNWPTIPNLKEANNNVKVLKSDHQKYIFNMDEKITYQEIKEESLFITLQKK